MPAAILIVDYDLGEDQKTLPGDAWRARAHQIAGMAGLRWKYWLRAEDGDGRGGVYLFDAMADAERAGETLVGSLRQAGARNVVRRLFSVDAELSSITRGRA